MCNLILQEKYKVQNDGLIMTITYYIHTHTATQCKDESSLTVPSN